MSAEDYNDIILKEKINKFKERVLEAAEELEIKYPLVKIWNCPSSNGGEIAHCHHDSRTICISEEKLKNLSENEIRETAHHEVSHLLHPNHGYHFHQTNDRLRQATWKVPTGVGITQFSERELKKVKNKKVRTEKDKIECNYYQGENHVSGKLESCLHCKRYFCNNHIEPRSARVGRLNEYKDLENENTHPCIQYNEFLEIKKKEEEADYERKLEEMFRSRKAERKAIHSEEPKEVKKIHRRVKKNKSQNLKEDKDKKKGIFRKIRGFFE